MVSVYLQDWSSLEATHVQGQSSRLQGLQLFTEIQEYLGLMSNSGSNYQYEVWE